MGVLFENGKISRADVKNSRFCLIFREGGRVAGKQQASDQARCKQKTADTRAPASKSNKIAIFEHLDAQNLENQAKLEILNILEGCMEATGMTR